MNYFHCKKYFLRHKFFIAKIFKNNSDKNIFVAINFLFIIDGFFHRKYLFLD